MTLQGIEDYSWTLWNLMHVIYNTHVICINFGTLYIQVSFTCTSIIIIMHSLCMFHVTNTQWNGRRFGWLDGCTNWLANLINSSFLQCHVTWFNVTYLLFACYCWYMYCACFTHFNMRTTYIFPVYYTITCMLLHTYI